ncbi:hypothetical protein QWT69_06985 [Sporosarcina oncorhynchi]|uniref:LysM domain-containing protein n=1 Tax=Sporosarcina oncorhynchi TaxID=3056444 RepID=A0ABZ0LB68_9BACL|nr:hypothetical protein [Sporosarcina sp. T2O-4]WOV88841.1 hypothetical protein QWT69_06985 [Sporosarcina sp. T2O-4]
MRTIIIAALLFLVFHIIRVDLFDGTIPLAAFFGEETPCIEPVINVIQVTTIQGDTIETLLSMYPDVESTFVERLSAFYSLNPYLQNQELKGGLTVKLPITKLAQTVCE